MKDFNGVEIKAGDRIVYVRTRYRGNGPTLRRGTVLTVNERTIKVEEESPWKKGQTYPSLIRRIETVVVWPQAAAA